MGPLSTPEFFVVWVVIPVLVGFGLLSLLASKLNNYGIVDPAWAFGFLWPIGWMAVGCMNFGNPSRIALYGAMGALWSLRLGVYLTIRVARHHPKEDVRYEVLREKWKDTLKKSFLKFYLAQGFLVILMAVPFVIVFGNTTRQFEVLEWIGFAVWLIGFVGESTADWQMARFKAEPANKGRVCNVGLWRYSRHPNYFFESVIWWGIWIFACGSPWGWVTGYAPLLILCFLLRVTGIPLTEKCAIESKGEAYREYQRTTSAFVPWFSKQ
jgi:steroid 5-alpha reductase family enzyme